MTAAAGLFEVAESSEPGRIWFGSGGCVERHSDGTFAVFVHGQLLEIYSAEDVATRDVLIALVREHATREVLASAFRTSPATVGRVFTRFHRGGFRAVADYGRRGGWTVRTVKLEKRLRHLFEKGMGPRAAHRDVAKKMSYGTVYAIYREWLSRKEAQAGAPLAPGQSELRYGPASVEEVMEAAAMPPADHSAEEAVEGAEELLAVEEPVQPETAEAPPVPVPTPPAPGDEGPEVKEAGKAELPVTERAPCCEPTLPAVAPAPGTLVQHVGSWMLLGLLNGLGFYQLAASCRGEVAMLSLRPAIDALAIALAVGQKCAEGVRRLATPSAGTLLRHAAGLTASWVREVLHEFAKAASKTFPAKVAARLLARAGEGEKRVRYYVDNHLRRYTGKHTIRKGWRMQDKRAVPGTSDYYVSVVSDLLLSAARGVLALAGIVLQRST